MMIKRNAKIAVAAIAASTMALAGCGGGSGNAASGDKPTLSSDPVTIQLNWWGGDARIKNTNAIIEKFEAANPNIKVEGINADWSGYWDKLATSMAGGNAPDVIQMDELYLASYAANGSLYDLGKVSDYLDLSQMSSSLKGMGLYNGVQYAAPVSQTPFGVLVNNDILEKLGLTLPDTSNWSWDDLVDFAKQITEKSNGEITGIAPMNNGMSLQLWARQNNAALFKDGKVAIPEDVLTSYLQMAYDWTHGDQIAGTPDFWAEGASATIEQGSIATGKAAMTFTQAPQITAYSKAAGTENMSLVPMPTTGKNDKYGYLKPGMYFAISSTSEHPAEAAKLIDFIINSNESAEIGGTERGLPGNTKISESLAETATGTNKKALEFADQIADTLGDAPEITPNGASDLDKIIQRYQQDVVFGKQQPADAAKAMITELNNAITTA